MAAVTISRRLRATAPAALRSIARPAGCSVRAFSGKAEKKEALSNADITNYFLDLDVAAKKAVASDLPIRLSGRSGDIVTELYNATKGKNFDKVVKDLQGILAAVQTGGLVVERFFTTANYSEEECKKVVELLFTTKEPLTSFKDIKDADVKDIIIDNEGNMDAWRNVRKAVQALGVLPEVKAALDTLASEATLLLVKNCASKAAELRSAVSKTVDAVVSSAIPLSKAQQDTIKASLPAFTPAGQTLAVTFAVDPAVLGGLRIDMKNTTIDLSATSRLVEVMSGARVAKVA